MPENKQLVVGRPKKYRCVQGEPKIKYFKPQGVPPRLLREVLLTIDECEALCLADRQGKYHLDAARIMRISRQTFGNILASARQKVAEAILSGKALRIGGGTYEISKHSKEEKDA